MPTRCPPRFHLPTPPPEGQPKARSAYAQTDERIPEYGGPASREQKAARSLLFAGTILGLIGVSTVVAGVAALSGSDVFPKHTVFGFWSLHTWGALVLVLGLLELAASVAIFTGSALARWFGVAVGALNAVGQLFFAPAHPAWALAAFAADLLLIRALLAHGGEKVLGR